MAGVGEDVAQLAVAPHAAAVLGWAGTPAGEADGVLDAVGWTDVLDKQVVLPGVTEVVDVAQPGAATRGQVLQPGLCLHRRPRPTARTRAGSSGDRRPRRRAGGRPPS